MKHLTKIFALFFLILLFSCNESKSNLSVKGQALNAKAGAIVKTHNGIYYIAGLSEWPGEYHGKMIEVTGTYRYINHSKKSTKKQQVTEIVGKQQFIDNAAYKIIKK